MMGKTHILVGVTYGVLLLPSVVTTGHYTYVEYGAIVGGLVLGSLLPDLDHPHSLISQRLPIVGRFVSAMLRHRGLLHSLLGVVLLFVISGVLHTYMQIMFFSFLTRGVSGVLSTDIMAVFFTGLITGYILHIVADMMTVSGVKLFYPLKYNIGLPVVKTGGMREMVVRWVLLAVCVVQLVILFR